MSTDLQAGSRHPVWARCQSLVGGEKEAGGVDDRLMMVGQWRVVKVG